MPESGVAVEVELANEVNSGSSSSSEYDDIEEATDAAQFLEEEVTAPEQDNGLNTISGKKLHVYLVSILYMRTHIID